MRKHAVDYYRIGNPPEEFPANCILFDKGNGLRKFGLSRKRDQTRRTINQMCWALAVPLPCWMETTASSGWGHCLCFSEPDLHKAPEHCGYRKLDSLYRCPWTSLNWCGQKSFSGFSCPSGRNYHTSCLLLSAWQWLLPTGSVPYPLQWKWTGMLSRCVQYKFWSKPCSLWLKGGAPMGAACCQSWRNNHWGPKDTGNGAGWLRTAVTFISSGGSISHIPQKPVAY